MYATEMVWKQSLCALSALLPVILFAAPTPTFDLPRPADEKPELPVIEPPAPAPLILPPIPPPSDENRLSTTPSIYVRKIILDGSSVFGKEDFATVLAPYLNRKIATEELQNLRQAISRLYIENGYINSGAMIPDQAVTDGVILINIIEGTLSDIDIKGNRWLRDGYLRKRVELGVETPLNVNSLRERLQLLQQDPHIQRLNAALVPGVAPGEGILSLRVDEQKPYQLWLNVNNDRSPSVGSNQAELLFRHNSLTRNGDTLELAYGKTEGLDHGYVQYDIPVTAYDTSLGFKYSKDDSDVVEEPFDSLDIRSKSESLGIHINQPVYRTLNQTLSLGLSLEHRRSKSFLLGEPFSFNLGADKGETKVTVLRFSQNWLNRDRKQVLTARSQFSLGLDALDATMVNPEVNGKFFTWLGQFQWARQVSSRDIQILFRTDVQLSNDDLFPLEQIAIGGMNSVRGYRKNQLVRDNGVLVSLEARIPLWQNKFGLNRLELVPFIDYGNGWNKDLNTPSPNDIYSAGLGLRASLLQQRLHLSLYAAHAFRDIDNPENDLQDDGIHFQISGRLF